MTSKNITTASNIVELRGQQAFTNSLVVAEQIGVSHKQVLANIRKYKADFEEFGQLAFENRPFETAGGMQDREIAILNPAHAAFCLSQVRNFQAKKAIASLVYSLPSKHADGILSAIAGMDVQDLPCDRFVYVAQEETSKRYKVGISKDPDRRVAELNIGNPEQLTLVKVFHATEAGYLSETMAHKALSAYHLRSEWFSSDANISEIGEATPVRNAQNATQ